MRRTLRQLAAVKPTRYHEPGTPTGLTGLYTASTPRSTLLYLYSSTLDKLKTIPEHSVYRQSVEALTKHRMQAVESVKPAGYDAWVAKAQKLIQEHPEEFNVVSAGRIDGANAWRMEKDGKVYLVRQQPPEVDQRDQEWDGELNEGPELEGIRTQEEREDQVLSAERKPLDDTKQVAWEDEPQLTADQISEVEHKIGGGLIEEVIQVAESEAKLVDIMARNKVWENLEEPPVEGQWKYFERKS